MNISIGELKGLIDTHTIKLARIIDKHQFTWSDVVSLLVIALENEQEEYPDFFKELYDLEVELSEECNNHD